MKVAVLGLGRMGAVAATKLVESGHRVTVWNRTPGKGGDLVKRGATEASSVAEAVRAGDAVLTLLTNDEAVKDVCLGKDGAIAHIPDGAVLVDMSTVYPDTSRTLAEAAPPKCFVDAPILGGPEALMTGRAKLLVAGDPHTVRHLDKLWADLADAYLYCGPTGTATTLKLLSNLVLVGGTALLSEAVATAQAHGIGNDVLRRVLGESPAVAPGVRVRLDDVLEGDHDGWWTIALAEKDMDLALRLASAAGLTLPLGTAMREMLADAETAGHRDKDLGAVVEVVRESKDRERASNP